MYIYTCTHTYTYTYTYTDTYTYKDTDTHTYTYTVYIYTCVCVKQCMIDIVKHVDLSHSLWGVITLQGRPRRLATADPWVTPWASLVCTPHARLRIRGPTAHVHLSRSVLGDDSWGFNIGLKDPLGAKLQHVATTLTLVSLRLALNIYIIIRIYIYCIYI